ncbi:B3 domain-containing protein [Panicum miliaceum]|uniref:B3 domain-containing protein n=1 Tax=Panicum miliaceum TaxID=4540 RepID=A0A3L6THU7_PANMI|nr:B3 domain-containing protein [Panicum miliaceum]
MAVQAKSTAYYLKQCFLVDPSTNGDRRLESGSRLKFAARSFRLRDGMEEEMAGLSLGDFEFFKILLPGMYKEALRLPDKFARNLEARRDLKLRLAGGQTMPLWDVEVFADEKRGGMYLGPGWKKFARAHDLRDGYLLVFRYDDGAAALTVTVFDRSTCGKQYVHAGAAGGGEASRGAGAGRRSLAIAEPSHFAVSLRQCNLGTKQNQYLPPPFLACSDRNPPLTSPVWRAAPRAGVQNVPVEFQDAHGYARRRRVELRMGGRSWSVNLKRSKRVLGDRTAFKYGWHQFCVDNGLEVGDTCFFHVIREGACVDDDDDEEEWEDEWEDDEHVLKVEVRKKNGTMLT